MLYALCASHNWLGAPQPISRVTHYHHPLDHHLYGSTAEAAPPATSSSGGAAIVPTACARTATAKRSGRVRRNSRRPDSTRTSYFPAGPPPSNFWDLASPHAGKILNLTVGADLSAGSQRLQCKHTLSSTGTREQDPDYSQGVACESVHLCIWTWCRRNCMRLIS